MPLETNTSQTQRFSEAKKSMAAVKVAREEFISGKEGDGDVDVQSLSRNLRVSLGMNELIQLRMFDSPRGLTRLKHTNAKRRLNHNGGFYWQRATGSCNFLLCVTAPINYLLFHWSDSWYLLGMEGGRGGELAVHKETTSMSACC